MRNRQTTNRFILITLCVGLMGFIGPIIRWLTSPPDEFVALTSEGWGRFVYGLVLMVWPAQLLAVIDVNVGVLLARAVAVGGNLLVFAILGTVIAASARTRRTIAPTYFLTMLLVSAWAFFILPFEAIDFLAFATAVLIYTIPFAVIWRQDGRARR